MKKFHSIVQDCIKNKVWLGDKAILQRVVYGKLEELSVMYNDMGEFDTGNSKHKKVFK